jgi:hypothetical protein
LPLIQQSTRYLARAPMREPEPPLVVGQAHEVPLRDGDVRVEVTTPGGRVVAYEKEKVAGRQALTFTATDAPGIYRLSAAGHDGVMHRRPEGTFVVNVDPAESDPTPIDPARLRQLALGGGGVAAAPPKRRVELWHALGAALLLLLLGEALLLRRK